MNIISNTTNVLNPGRTPVNTPGQPIFTLTKELVVRFPDRFGSVYLIPPHKYVALNH